MDAHCTLLVIKAIIILSTCLHHHTFVLMFYVFSGSVFGRYCTFFLRSFQYGIIGSRSSLFNSKNYITILLLACRFVQFKIYQRIYINYFHFVKQCQNHKVILIFSNWMLYSKKVTICVCTEKSFNAKTNIGIKWFHFLFSKCLTVENFIKILSV